MLELTPAEFRLLKILASQPGHVFSREQLLNNLYDDYRVVTDRTIDSHIKIYGGNWNYSMAKNRSSARYMAWGIAGKQRCAVCCNSVLP